MEDKGTLNKYYACFEHFPLGILMLDSAKRIVYANNEFYDLSGCTPAEVMFQNIETQNRKCGIYPVLLDLFATACSGYNSSEVIFQKKNHEIVYCMAYLLSFDDVKDKRFQYMIVLNNTSEVKRLEQDLRKSEEQFRLIVQNVNEYIYSAEFDKGEVVTSYHSPKCLDITGYEPEEFYANPLLWFEMIYEPDRPMVLAFIKKNRVSNVRSYIEHRIVRKDGVIRWVSNSASVQGKNDDIGRIDGTIQDITVRRESIEQLRKLSRAVEQSPASVIITDIEGNIDYVNPKFTNLTGYALHEVLGKNPRILKSGLANSEFYRNLWETILQGKEWTGEFHNKKKNGELYWENASISPIRNNDGEITHFLAVKEDITQRKKAEEALQMREAELRVRNTIMEKELLYAKQVQYQLLPQQAPEVDGMKIAYRFQPLEEIGGDYFSFFTDNNTLGVFIGDVAGHGVSAALFLSLLKFTTETIMRRHISSPDLFLEELNNQLLYGMTNYFITAVYFCFAVDKNNRTVTCTYANGAHPPCVYYNSRDNLYELLHAKGTLVGMLHDRKYECKQFTLFPGDRIYLYTDGIPETINNKEEIIGFEHVPELIKGVSCADLDETLDAFLNEIHEYRGTIPLSDDIVLIGMEIV